MPESTAFSFTHKELTEILIKHLGIKEGTWGVSVKFGLSATMTEGMHDDKPGQFPTAIIPVLEIGVREFDTKNSLTVDASKLGRPKKKRRIKNKTAAKRKSATKVAQSKRRKRTT